MASMRPEGASRLPFQSLSATAKRDLDQLAAMALYGGARPFATYTDPGMKALLKGLNAAYTPPDRHALAGRLLDDCYDKVKAKVDNRLANCSLLNFVTDESSNVQYRRIVNLSVHTADGVFFQCSEPTGAQSMASEDYAKWIFRQLIEITCHDLSRVNSLATDTCATMRKIWRVLGHQESLRRVFFVPCDSHGLQLLIKDILGLPWCHSVHQRASSVTTAFRRAPLQYEILREKQLLHYGKHQALLASVITRWGSQVTMANSVLRNKQALKDYAVDDRAKTDKAVVATILDKAFWEDLEDLVEVLRPIDEVLAQSEGQNSHLGLVTARWLSIEARIRRLRSTDVTKAPVAAILEDVWQQRFRKQVNGLHWTAFLLDPASITYPLDDYTQDLVMETMTRYIPQPLLAQSRRAFFLFRQKQDVFSPGANCWQDAGEPWLFWQIAHHHSPGLATLASRLFKTPANSVPSERAFSTQNLIHTKTRNRLDTQRVDKLTYVHVNQRVLDHCGTVSSEPVPRTFYDLPATEVIDLEEEALEELRATEWVQSEVEGDTQTPDSLLTPVEPEETVQVPPPAEEVRDVPGSAEKAARDVSGPVEEVRDVPGPVEEARDVPGPAEEVRDVPGLAEEVRDVLKRTPAPLRSSSRPHKRRCLD